MSEQTAEATATETTDATEQQPKPTETVDFWKGKAREQEKRAKENAAAAKRLGELEDAQKTEQEKSAERVAKAEAEVAAIPTRVAESLRTHLVELHEIDKDDAELFLTANEPELLIKQVTRLLGQSDKRKQTHRVPTEGKTTPKPGDDQEREFVRDLFSRAD